MVAEAVPAFWRSSGAPAAWQGCPSPPGWGGNQWLWGSCLTDGSCWDPLAEGAVPRGVRGTGIPWLGWGDSAP